MSTSKEDIKEWFDDGKKHGATHMLVVCDTFDWEDYPVYVTTDKNVQELIDHNNQNMKKVVEVYAMHLDRDTQINENRAWNVETE